MDSVSLVLEPTHDQEVKTTNPRKPQSHLQSAPWSNVPGLKIVDVEHPFLIKNIHKAMETLGGHRNISAVRPFRNNSVDIRSGGANDRATDRGS